jgi:hypothetical protein
LTSNHARRLRLDYMLANILQETKERFHMKERSALSRGCRSAFFSIVACGHIGRSIRNAMKRNL